MKPQDTRKATRCLYTSRAHLVASHQILAPRRVGRQSRIRLPSPGVLLHSSFPTRSQHAGCTLFSFHNGTLCCQGHTGRLRTALLPVASSLWDGCRGLLRTSDQLRVLQTHEPCDMGGLAPQAGSGVRSGSEQESFLTCQHPRLASSCSHPLPVSQEEVTSWGPWLKLSPVIHRRCGAFKRALPEKQL